MIKLFKKIVAAIRTYFHCFSCPRFRTCEIKFCPTESEVFTSFSADNEFLYFEDSVECEKPIEDWPL